MKLISSLEEGACKGVGGAVGERERELSAIALSGSRPRASSPFTSRRCCGGVGVGVSSDDYDSLSCVANFTMGT